LEEKYNNFLKRTITIVIGIPFIIFIIFYGGLPFFVIATLLLVYLGLRELYNLTHKKGTEPSLIWGFLLSLYFIFLPLFDKYNLDYNKINIIVFIILSYFISQFFKKNYSMMLSNISLTIFGSIYVGYLFSFIIRIKNLPNGNYFLIFLLFITWINDVAAYIIGIKFGKNKIFPKISPMKTIEGSLGGIIFGVISVFIFKNWINLTFDKIILLGLIITIIAQLGDLFESMLKRCIGVKDSGNIIPGHGGILDSFDSLLFAAPVFYYCIIFLT
jgi:phosphatidate cytidylyltransferase